MIEASLHRKTTKKKFVAELFERYPQGVTHSIAYEMNYDDEYAKPLAVHCFYEVLTPEPNYTDRHCGTWMKGEAWEFVRPTVVANTSLLKDLQSVQNEGACSFCGSTEGDCCEAWDADHAN